MYVSRIDTNKWMNKTGENKQSARKYDYFDDNTPNFSGILKATTENDNVKVPTNPDVTDPHTHTHTTVRFVISFSIIICSLLSLVQFPIHSLVFFFRRRKMHVYKSVKQRTEEKIFDKLTLTYISGATFDTVPLSARWIAVACHLKLLRLIVLQKYTDSLDVCVQCT